jgi:eukaryotic-like serine/threonine-protein kinase
MAIRIESQAEPIPGYTLIERMGGGGFGEVWKAIAPGGILKAIKFVYGNLQTESEETQRAEQELKALSRVKTVRHPYILSLERYDIIDGQLIIVMELADRNLWDRFRECRAQGLHGIPREELLRYMAETAEALDLMNGEYQLQHLDIKPQNLFLVHNHAKVADFGLVKDLEGMMASVTGGVTPVYAAPETFDGWVSRFCDQYSLGIVYQELLTGQRPFNGTNVRQLILQHLQTPPDLSPLPPGDRELIGRALSKNPEERFPCCLDLVKALCASGGAAIQTGDASSASTGDHETPAGGWSEHGKDFANGSVTPADQTEAGRRYIRVQPAAEYAPEMPEAPAPPPEEVNGTGILFPAIVIGVGGVGLSVLRRLKAALQEQQGSVDALPQIRLLYLDADPAAPREAAQKGVGAPLAPNEVLQARLNRPSYYLRSHEGRARVDSWFNTKMLYRIPRNLATTGCRALGRLAFVDNYRAIVRRLENELETCTREDGLRRAAEETKLGLRTNRPRVYIVTGLAGGTGGGMFLDLAYVVKNLLKTRGYPRAETVGLFLLPEVDRQSDQKLALGNAFAALTELNHFSTPGTHFQVRYDDKAGAITDGDPPFSRCIVLPPPSTSDPDSTHEVATLTADFLRRDLTTALGRAADECRAGLVPSAPKPRGLLCQAFGLQRIAWPRRAVLWCTARLLCTQVVQHWMTKDAAAVRDAVHACVTEFWAQERLGSEQVLIKLNAICEKALGRSPESLFAEWTEPLTDAGGRGVEELPALLAALEQMEQVVGRPDCDAGAVPGTLAEPLQDTGTAILEDWGEKLAGFTVRLIEEPLYRLAGAEEAARQMVSLIEGELKRNEPLAKELATRAAEARTRIGELAIAIKTHAASAKRGQPPVAALVELLRVYPKWRHQSLVMQRLVSIYVSLRGQLSDQLREVNFCRDRLKELLRSFEASVQDADANQAMNGTRQLFPNGGSTLREAVQQLSKSFTADELRDFDCQMQKLIRQQFTALVHVCMTSSNLLKNLEVAMQQEAEAIVESRLDGANIAEMYLEHHPEEAEAEEDLVSVFDAAAPRLTPSRNSRCLELCLLGTPTGPAGERIRERARQALTDVDLAVTTSSDDIVFYREIPQFALSDLEHLGPLAYESYCQLAANDAFSPHSRSDITEWRAASVVCS